MDTIRAIRTAQCRCVLDEQRCPNVISADEPFCHNCEARHPELSHELDIDVVPLGMP